MQIFWLRFTQWFTRLHPTIIVVYTYVFGILVGTGLLMLPIATTSGYITPIDALFTATSALCVTGLAVVDTGTYYTVFGQLVILFLIQIGGLGIMTISVALFRFLGRTIAFHHRMIIQETFAHTPRADIYQILKSVFLFTALTELLGALGLFFVWNQEYPWYQAAYISLFHAISSFCNAGFSLFSNNLINYQDSWAVNLIICILITMGGIGFPVVYDLYYTNKDRKAGKRTKLLMQTKVVLVTSAILTTAGAVLFYWLELENILQGRPMAEQFLISLFQSVTCRTAGYNTVDLAQLTEPTLTVMMLLMFIGASPGSCGGGIKTTTAAAVAAFLWYRFKHENSIHMFKKNVPTESLFKSALLILLSMGWIAMIFFALLIVMPHGLAVPTEQEQGGHFLPYMFETISAFGTVGLSMGITPEMNALGKFALVVMMFIGRVGVLTFSYVIAGPMATRGIEYAEENMMIG